MAGTLLISVIFHGLAKTESESRNMKFCQMIMYLR